MRLNYFTLAISTALLAACGTQSMPSRDMAQFEHQSSKLARETSPNMSTKMVEVADAGLDAFYRSTPAPMAMMVRESIRQPENTERYADTPANPVQAVAQSPVSTFGVDVDTGSYANVRRLLNDGQLPPQGAVRVEEIVNYFDYGYATPSNGAPFAVRVDTADSPWQPNAKLVRIAIIA